MEAMDTVNFNLDFFLDILDIKGSCRKFEDILMKPVFQVINYM